MTPVGSGEGQSTLCSIMKFKNICIWTESKTFYPHEKGRTYFKKRPSPDNDVIRCVITITGLCISYWY